MPLGGEPGLHRVPHLQGAGVGAADFGVGPKDDLAFIGVHHRLVPSLHRVQQAAYAAERRDAEGAGQDGGVPPGAALLDGDAADAAGVPFQQLRRAEAPGDQDGATRDGDHARLLVQRGQQTLGQVLQVRQPLP